MEHPDSEAGRSPTPTIPRAAINKPDDSEPSHRWIEAKAWHSPDRTFEISFSGHQFPYAKEELMSFILWIIAVVLVIAGIFSIIKSQLLKGIVLIVLGLLVGPGGVSLFT